MSIELAPRDTTNFHLPDDLRPDVDGLEVAGDDLPEEEGGHRGHERQAHRHHQDHGEGAQPPPALKAVPTTAPPPQPQQQPDARHQQGQRARNFMG